MSSVFKKGDLISFTEGGRTIYAIVLKIDESEDWYYCKFSDNKFEHVPHDISSFTNFKHHKNTLLSKLVFQ